jgi:hypothetical protein
MWGQVVNSFFTMTQLIMVHLDQQADLVIIARVSVYVTMQHTHKVVFRAIKLFFGLWDSKICYK